MDLISTRQTATLLHRAKWIRDKAKRLSLRYFEHDNAMDIDTIYRMMVTVISNYESDAFHIATDSAIQAIDAIYYQLNQLEGEILDGTVNDYEMPGDNDFI